MTTSTEENQPCDTLRNAQKRAADQADNRARDMDRTNRRAITVTLSIAALVVSALIALVWRFVEMEKPCRPWSTPTEPLLRRPRAEGA